MATILKIPSHHSKGILIFTSIEDREFINNKFIYQRIEKLKVNWIIGLHHNWQNFKLNPKGIYDFHMAGETDLKSINNKQFCHIPIECTHFTPEYFQFSNTNKMWDILYVGKAVNFKKIPDFFKIIRELYDEGNMVRVLFISPIPPACKKNIFNLSYFCNIRKVYNEMFSSEERKLFNLLTIDYEYPYPFDLETLAYFYKSSRIFVFTSDDERRPRTVAYAIASGMPVVVMKSVASLVPKEKQIKPYIYLANSYEEYPKLIKEALNFTRDLNYKKESMMEGINEFNTKYNLDKLRNILLELFQVDIYEEDKNNSILYDLDIRLARHHGLGESGLSIGWSLESFLTYIEKRKMEEMRQDLQQSKDFEREISNLTQYGEKEYKSLEKKNLLKEIFFELALPLYRRSNILQKLYKKFNKIKFKHTNI